MRRLMIAAAAVLALTVTAQARAPGLGNNYNDIDNESLVEEWLTLDKNCQGGNKFACEGRVLVAQHLLKRSKTIPHYCEDEKTDAAEAGCWQRGGKARPGGSVDECMKSVPEGTKPADRIAYCTQDDGLARPKENTRRPTSEPIYCDDQQLTKKVSDRCWAKGGDPRPGGFMDKCIEASTKTQFFDKLDECKAKAKR